MLMPNILRRRLHQILDSKIRAATGLLPIAQTAKEDVFIVGYPKSGNTWMQNLVIGLIYHVDPEFAPDALVQDLIPDVHFRRYYRRYRTPMFFKSHDLPRPEYKRVVYLLRDGRDVMVSYLHQLQALQGKKIDFLRMVKVGEGLFPCKWHEHVQAWMANPYNSEMLVLKYENLKYNPIKELRRFCEFVSVDRTEAFLRAVYEKASFDKMRKKEVDLGWDDPNWPKEHFFLRQGQVASYKREMPPDVLEAFVCEAHPYLVENGYL